MAVGVKRWPLISAALVAAAGMIALVRLDAMAGVGAGYMAKVGCSEIFLAKRDTFDVLRGEFKEISPVLDRVRLRIDTKVRSVSGSVFGLGGARAIYRDGYGCTLIRGGAPEALPPLAPITDKPLPDAREGSPAARDDIDYASIERALDAAFDNPNAATRAILVVNDGAVIAERYAKGFSAETPLLSWSMGKSVTASMAGAAVMRGLIDVNEPAPVREWQGADDPRARISWSDLLRMQSGLAFSEIYGDPNSDVSRMLFRARDAGAVAAKQKLDHEPGIFWSYSSGTTNLIQRTLRDVLEANDVGYHSFARAALFEPLGMASMTMEPDSSGTFVGSSFMYATARDWAKLGLLYLNDGVANGERLLPEGWRQYVTTPAAASDGQYGAHFWLNRPGAAKREKYMPGVPDDAFFMAGHEGQYVLMIPGKNLVIVRAGMTRGTEPMPVVAPTFAAIYAAVSP